MERSRRLPLGDVTEELDNVLRLRLAAKTQPAGEQRYRRPRLGRDWTAALEAVQQASDSMTAAERRARDIEARGVALAERALKELKAAEARAHAAEEALRAAETRAHEAETRAQEAEEWLHRLNEAIHDRLVLRPAEMRQGASAAA